MNAGQGAFSRYSSRSGSLNADGSEDGRRRFDYDTGEMQRESATHATRRASTIESPAEAEVWQEGEWFVARAQGVEVASQGKTREEALANLREALELHYEEPVATSPPA